MIPFITCEISLCHCVCELVFGVNVFDLDLGVQNDSIKQPIKSNSVGSGNVSHCWTSASSQSLLRCPQKCRAPHQIEKTSRSMKHNRHCSIQDCRAELESQLGFLCVFLMVCHAASFPALFLLISLVGWEKNGTLQQPNPRDRERKFHPCVDLHQEK